MACETRTQLSAIFREIGHQLSDGRDMGAWHASANHGEEGVEAKVSGLPIGSGLVGMIA